MIIDFRLRPPIAGFKRAVMFANPDRTARMGRCAGMEPAPSLYSARIEDTLQEMDDAGISLGVIPARRGSAVLGDASNEEVATFVREHPNRFVGFGAPDLSDLPTAAKEIEQLSGQSQFKGVVLEPGQQSPPLYSDDPSLFPIYDVCQQLNLPVILMAGGNAGPDITFTSPQLVEHVATEFPRLELIIVHGGWPWVTEILYVAFRRENVYISPDWYIYGMPGWRDYVDAGNGFLQDRYIFATAYPFIPMGSAVKRFRKLFRPEVLPKLMSGNGLRLLRMEETDLVKNKEVSQLSDA